MARSQIHLQETLSIPEHLDQDWQGLGPEGVWLQPEQPTGVGRSSSPRHELISRPLGPVLGVHHEEHVGEASAKVGTIRVMVA